MWLLLQLVPPSLAYLFLEQQEGQLINRNQPVQPPQSQRAGRVPGSRTRRCWRMRGRPAATSCQKYLPHMPT